METELGLDYIQVSDIVFLHCGALVGWGEAQKAADWPVWAINLGRMLEGRKHR